ncbi:DNA polymerase III subunit gamma/tau [Candidatus Omnitrophota bacterium]
MAYIVFALKWRPQNFEEIVGQKQVVATLKSALEMGRTAHAYIFAGPRGVGKTSTARILAKALNCQEGPTAKPCLKCSACREIADGRSIDVIEIDGASNRGIDEVRTLRESVKFAPIGGKSKIYIIDEVHMLTTEAFNALLKTLEEPPPFVKFIFATTQPQKVIPTILSRCHRFDFRRISAMETVAQLEKIAAAEKVKVDKEVFFAIARASDGSLRDAESVLDQLVSFSKGKVSLNDVVSMLGLIEQEALFEITDKITEKDAQGALGLLNSIIDEGKDTGVFLKNLIEHFRNLMIAKVSKGDPKLIDLPDELRQKLCQQAEAFSLEELFVAFNTLVGAQGRARRLDSLRIPLEVGLIKLIHDKKGQANLEPPLRTAKKDHIKPQEKKRPEANNLPARVPKSEPEPERIDPVSRISLEQVKEVWQSIIEGLSRVKMYLSTYISDGVPVKVENNILTISFPKNYSLHKESLENKDNRAIVENVLSEAFSTKMRVNFTLSKEAAAPATESAQDNPLIQSAVDAFKARVIRE